MAFVLLGSDFFSCINTTVGKNCCKDASNHKHLVYFYLLLCNRLELASTYYHQLHFYRYLVLPYITLLSVSCIALYRSCKAVNIRVSDCFPFFFTGISTESFIMYLCLNYIIFKIIRKES